MSPLSTNYTKEQQEEISSLRNKLYDLRQKRDYLIHKIAANDHFARTNGTKFPSGNIYSRHYVYDDSIWRSRTRPAHRQRRSAVSTVL